MLNKKLGLLIFPMLVTACGGGSSSSDNSTEDNLEFSQPISFFGRVVSSKSIYDGSRVMYANFRVISPPTEYVQFRSEVTTALDTCRVIDTREMDNGETVETNEFWDAATHVPTPISAGSTLEVYDDQGYFDELIESNTYNDHYYSGVSGEHPDNLMVNIPGATFPGIQEVPLPDKETLIVTSIDFNQMMNASDHDIPEGHAYRWVASDNPDSRVHIAITYSSDIAETKVFCRVADDGEFTLTERIREMITDEMSAHSVDMYRHTEHRVAVGDNAVLDMLTIDIAENP